MSYKLQFQLTSNAASNARISANNHRRMTAEQSLGESCDRLGLSAKNLIDKLPAIKDDDLTNGVVLEIFTHYKIMNGAVDWCSLNDSVYKAFLDCGQDTDTGLYAHFPML